MTAELLPDADASICFTPLEEIPHPPDQLIRDIVKGGLAIVLATGAITVSASALHKTNQHALPPAPTRLNNYK